MIKKAEPFWLDKPLKELNSKEWESICDGCAKCCTLKLEDMDDGNIYDTNVVCRFLDIERCQCGCYQERSINVPDCITLTNENLASINFMPPSCSYRLLLAGKPLPKWHHLICGDYEQIHAEGKSVQGKVISETEADDLEYHLTGEIIN
ncbi:MAG: YcgN family cysteine cluster protein [Gammaproteobacteria bacterium]|nr:YcgN family cysteine cluster protein [Gammaproteobacteria bacterium]